MDRNSVDGLWDWDQYFRRRLIVSYLFVLPNRSTYEETFFSGLKHGEIIDDVFESQKKSCF